MAGLEETEKVYRTLFYFGGHSGGYKPGDSPFPQGEGPSYIEMTVKKFSDSVSFNFTGPTTFAFFSRSTARKIAADILEFLGPETEGDRNDAKTLKYEHPK